MTREQFNTYLQKGDIGSILHEYYSENNKNPQMSFNKGQFNMMLNSWIMFSGQHINSGYSVLLDIVEKNLTT
mgnify:FL=1